jgi:hypothetical protein
MDNGYTADITDIRGLMSSPSATIEAISLEIGRSPRMAFLEDPAEIPAVPERPMVVLVELKPRDISGMTLARKLRAGHRLMKAVITLMRDERPGWLIEADEPEEFGRAYRAMFERVLEFEEPSSVLLYVPHHGAQGRLELSYENLSRTRSMLEFLGYRMPEEPVAAPASTEPTPLEAARERRTQLLKEEQWLDSGKVHQQQQGGSPTAPGANNTASRLRRKGELLGAWDGREYLHPAFQFDRDTGRAMHEMKELLDLLPKDPGGWRQTFWLYQAHALLEGKRPADVFQSDPQSVLKAARSTFAPGNTNW